jgi:putative transposase
MQDATMLETLYSLGIIPSRSRPRVSRDNPYAESIFKTLKYVPNYQPEGFNSLMEARLWIKHFVDWYNNEHRHSGINYVTPAERHAGKDVEVLEKRKAIYEKTRQEHPERWSGKISDWDYSDTEWLNPR